MKEKLFVKWAPVWYVHDDNVYKQHSTVMPKVEPTSDFDLKELITFWWLSAILLYLQCIKNGNTAVWH